LSTNKRKRPNGSPDRRRERQENNTTRPARRETPRARTYIRSDKHTCDSAEVRTYDGPFPPNGFQSPRARDLGNDFPCCFSVLPGRGGVHNHHILHVEVVSQTYKSVGIFCVFRKHNDERVNDNVVGWNTGGPEQCFVPGAGDDYTMGDTRRCVVRMLEPFSFFPELLRCGS